MKSLQRILLFFYIFISTNSLQAQNSFPNGIEFTDITGNIHNIDQYLNDDKHVVIQFFATNCLPCWNLYQSSEITGLDTIIGQSGTADMIIIMLEINRMCNDVMALEGIECSLGDWITGNPLPIVNMTEEDIENLQQSDFGFPGFTPYIISIRPDSNYEDWGAAENLQDNILEYYFDFFLENSSCDASLTSDEASILIPSENVPLLNNEPIPLGTVIQAYYEVNGEKHCAGQVVWTGESAFFNVVGNDEAPPLVNGYNIGDEFTFQYVLPSGCIVEEVEQTYLTGSFFDGFDTYQPNRISGIETMVANVDLNPNADYTFIASELSFSFSNTSTGISNQYEWSFGDGNTSSNPNPAHIYSQEGGYEVCLKVFNDCGEDEICQNITVESCNLSILPSVLNTTCGESNGSISLDLNNPSLSSTYQWSNGQTTSSISNLIAGEYAVTINYGNSCEQVIENINIESSTLPLPIVTNAINTLTCSEPTALLDASNSETTFSSTFSWLTSSGNNIGNSESLEVNMPGSYILIITNQDGCSAQTTVDIQENTTLPVVNTGSDVQLMCPSLETVLTGEVSGGNNLAFQWLNQDMELVSSTINAITNTEGLYTLEVTNLDNGCSSSDEVMVSLGDSPEADAGVNQEITCSQQSVILGNTITNPIFNYQWTSPNGFTSSEVNPIVTVAGLYTLTVTNPINACSDSDAIEVIELPNTVSLSASTQNSNCESSTGSITITPQNGTPPFNYFLNGEQQSSNVFTNLSADIYTLLIIDANGCEDTSEIIISNYESENIDLGNNQSLCEGESTILTLENDSLVEYLWSTGETTPSISTSTPGNYSVTVTNAFNCTSSSSIEVETISNVDLAISNSNIESICLGETIQYIVSGNEINMIEWIDDSNTLNIEENNSAIANPTSSTSYTVIANNACFEEQFTININVYEPTEIIANDITILRGNDASLIASGGASYEWIILSAVENTLSCITCENPIIPDVEEDIEVLLKITDANGCKQEVQLTVRVTDDPTDLVERINIITPNGDGKNDLLIFEELIQHPKNTLRVYNRWGQIVYDAVGYLNDWNGTYKGKVLPAGNYYYVLSIDDTNQRIQSNLIIARD